MSDFPITIDATPLYHESPIPHHEQLSLCRGGNAGTDWFLTKEIQHVHLEPDSYKFQAGSSIFAAFNFSVTSEGTIQYDSSFDEFVEGRGTSKLTLKGVEVSFDRSYLTGPILYLNDLAWQSDPITTNTPVTLLPADYSLIVGSGTTASFSFTLKGDGTFAFTDPAYEIEPDGSGGFLKGGGTNKLEFLGYPVLFDARFATGGNGVGLEDLGLPFVTSAVQFANLLPATYSIWYNSDNLVRVFTLDVHGNILPADAEPPLIQVKRFHDLTLLVIGS